MTDGQTADNAYVGSKTWQITIIVMLQKEQNRIIIYIQNAWCSNYDIYSNILQHNVTSPTV